MVWGTLAGATNVHVPFVEMYAVFAAAMIHAPQWTGRVVRFGVDSAPVCDCVNKGSSPDPYLLLLSRYLSMLQCRYRFDVLASHCAREYNGLADAATRHTSVQDFAPFLRRAGFSELGCAATPSLCRWRSPLASGKIFASSLGTWRSTRSR